jgi:hypothetical protein
MKIVTTLVRKLAIDITDSEFSQRKFEWQWLHRNILLMI